MRPNLSIEHLAMTLAALGTTAVVSACTRAEPAGARADQTPTSSTTAAAPPPPPEAVPEDTRTKAEGKKEPPAPTPIATATAAASARPIVTPRKRMDGDKGGTGQASCGAGTCTADPKKK